LELEGGVIHAKFKQDMIQKNAIPLLLFPGAFDNTAEHYLLAYLYLVLLMLIILIVLAIVLLSSASTSSTLVETANSALIEAEKTKQNDEQPKTVDLYFYQKFDMGVIHTYLVDRNDSKFGHSVAIFHSPASGTGFTIMDGFTRRNAVRKNGYKYDYVAKGAWIPIKTSAENLDIVIMSGGFPVVKKPKTAGTMMIFVYGSHKES